MTIFALSSGKGRAGVSVLRLSGPEAGSALKILTQKDHLPEPRKAALQWLYDPENGNRLDQALILWFPAPASFTGEDVVELHVHGGRAVVTGLLNALGSLTGLRLAEPGEFTRRAFDNNKMDLTAAEGLADLINAETEAQRRQALRIMEGRLADLYEGWRKKITTAMAYLEADIDFADEEIPDDVTARVRPQVEALQAEITAHVEDGHKGELIRDGLQVVILGEPNIGKSTLLNYLSRRDVAIVSDIAGTTRDILEVHLDINGYALTIADTAGLRESRDVIEAEGVRRAEQRAEKADIKILMVDAREWPILPARIEKTVDQNTLILLNKIDLLAQTPDHLTHQDKDCIEVLGISAKDEQGLDVFLNSLTNQVEKRMELTEAPNLTRTRHRLALMECLEHLQRFLDSGPKEVELLAEDLRMAARSLGRITGLVDVEDILGVIFSEFCIGK